MKQLFFVLTSLIITLGSCKKSENVTIDIPNNSNQPNGIFTAKRSGSLLAQSGTPTQGTTQLGTDAQGTQFLKLGADFKSDYHSGAVTLYLSKSAVFNTSTVQLISLVSKDGEQYFKVTPSVGNDFTHLLVWCGAARIPFGNSELK